MIDPAALQGLLDHLARLAIEAREKGLHKDADVFWRAFDRLQSLLDAPDRKKIGGTRRLNGCGGARVAARV